MPGNDTYTKLLLHCDGSDGSTSFPDASAAANTVTVNGNVQVDTAQSKFGGASALFDGAGDYLTVAHGSNFDLGTGDFTIDFWVRFNAVPGTVALYASRNDDGSAQKDLVSIYWYGSTGELYFQALQNGTGVAQYRFSWSPSTATWYHLAAVRSGTSFFIFINGTSQSLTTDIAIGSNSLSPTYATPTFAIGRYGNYDNFYHDGWIDEFRWSKGVARWTSNFTPPSAAYSADLTPLTAETRSFALTGIAAAFNTKLASGAGAFTRTGQPATLAARLAATASPYALTGKAALFAGAMPVEAGAYALGGVAAQAAMPVGTGDFAVAGSEAAFGATLAAETQGYAVTWQAFSDAGTLAAGAGSFALAAPDAGYSYDIDLGGIGGRIAGGQFSRGRWREFKEAERQAREAAERARARIEEEARDAARAKASEQRARIAALRAAQDAANAERARRQAAIDALAALSGAQETSETLRAAAVLQDAASAAQARRLADEEDEVVHLLLLS